MSFGFLSLFLLTPARFYDGIIVEDEERWTNRASTRLRPLGRLLDSGPVAATAPPSITPRRTSHQLSSTSHHVPSSQDRPSVPRHTALARAPAVTIQPRPVHPQLATQLMSRSISEGSPLPHPNDQIFSSRVPSPALPPLRTGPSHAVPQQQPSRSSSQQPDEPQRVMTARFSPYDATSTHRTTRPSRFGAPHGAQPQSNSFRSQGGSLADDDYY